MTTLSDKEKMRLRSIKERESNWYFKTLTKPNPGHMVTVGFIEGLKFAREKSTVPLQKIEELANQHLFSSKQTEMYHAIEFAHALLKELK